MKNILTRDSISDMLEERKIELAEGGDEGSKEQRDEIDELQDLLDDMPENAALIKAGYFFDGFAKDEAASVHDTVKGWPFDYIDWEKAANALAMDYRHLDVLGVDYMTRHF